MKNKSLIINTIYINVLLLILFFVGGLLGTLIKHINDSSFFSSIYYVIFSIVFVVYIYNRISYKRQRIPLLLLSLMIFLWALFRGMKYGPFQEVDVVARHLWYMYYIPMLLIPFFVFLSSTSYGFKNNRKKNLAIIIPVLAVTISLILLVLTNDLHQWAFTFNANFENWDSDYKHNVVYFIIMGWTAILFITAFAFMLKQSSIVVGKKYFWMPIIPVILGLTWIILDLLGIIPKWQGYNYILEFPDVVSYMTAGFILSCIKLGLISANDDYDELFRKSYLPMVITEQNGSLVYISSTSLTTDKKDWPKSNKSEVLGDIFIKNTAIRGGNVILEENIKELNEINKELAANNESLKEEEQLITLKNKLKEERLSTDEKNRLYDHIANATLSQSKRISDLCELIEKDISLFDKYMPFVCFYSAFIKRYANMRLIYADSTNISMGELYLAISESLKYLPIHSSINGHKDKEMNGSILIEAYECFEKIIEDNIESITGVIVSFPEGDDCLFKMVIEGTKIDKIKNQFKYIKVHQSVEDEINYLNIKIKEGK